MNEEQHAHKEQAGDKEPSPPKEVKEFHRKQDATHYEPPQSLYQEWRALALDRRIESTIAILGLLIASFVAVVALNQLDTMREQTDAMKKQTEAMQSQLTEMKSGSDDTKIIAQSAKTQSENTKTMVKLPLSKSRN